MQQLHHAVCCRTVGFNSREIQNSVILPLSNQIILPILILSYPPNGPFNIFKQFLTMAAIQFSPKFKNKGCANSSGGVGFSFDPSLSYSVIWVSLSYMYTYPLSFWDLTKVFLINRFPLLSFILKFIKLYHSLHD